MLTLGVTGSLPVNRDSSHLRCHDEHDNSLVSITFEDARKDIESIDQRESTEKSGTGFLPTEVYNSEESAYWHAVGSANPVTNDQSSYGDFSTLTDTALAAADERLTSSMPPFPVVMYPSQRPDFYAAGEQRYRSFTRPSGVYDATAVMAPAAASSLALTPCRDDLSAFGSPTCSSSSRQSSSQAWLESLAEVAVSKSHRPAPPPPPPAEANRACLPTTDTSDVFNRHPTLYQLPYTQAEHGTSRACQDFEDFGSRPQVTFRLDNLLLTPRSNEEQPQLVKKPPSLVVSTGDGHRHEEATRTGGEENRAHKESKYLNGSGFTDRLNNEVDNPHLDGEDTLAIYPSKEAGLFGLHASRAKWQKGGNTNEPESSPVHRDSP
ncbi:unnamed protein product, partial [Protopolystoma xenopodis]